MNSSEDRATTTDIRARAAQWVVERRSSDHWNETSQTELQAWLAQSPSHAVEFLRLEAAWDRTARLAALRQPGRHLFGRNSGLVSTFVRVAAGLVLVAVVGVAVEQFSHKPELQTYATTIGGRETLKLADGSTVELNTDSLLRTGFSDGERRVWLDKGEAYFQIVHDSAHPFIVMVGDHRITDLGTKFVVRQEVGAVEVSLVEGRAQMDSDKHHVVLRPGDIALATARSLTVTRQRPETIEAALSWRHGMLVFHHATLAEAVAEFNRYNREKLAVGDAYAASQTFNGTLPTNDVAAFVRVTRKTFGLHVARRRDETVISR